MKKEKYNNVLEKATTENEEKLVFKDIMKKYTPSAETIATFFCSPFM
ncbi:hypothetical protein ABEP00_20290 [Heyndrickxia sporothermodurans]